MRSPLRKERAFFDGDSHKLPRFLVHNRLPKMVKFVTVPIPGAIL